MKEVGRKKINWDSIVTVELSLKELQLIRDAMVDTDLKDMKGETRKYYAELKDKYKVRKIVSTEEMEKIIADAEEKHGSYYAKLFRAQQQ